MGAPASPAVTFVAGDDETYVLTICSDDTGETPVDITGRTYVMSLLRSSDREVIAYDSGTVVGASGQVTFEFTDTQTGALTEVPHEYKVVETVSGAGSTLILAPLGVVVP